MGTCFAQGVCMYRIVIYEDTESEARTLLGHIERYGAEHGVQFQTTWERSAFGIGIDSERADLIFMDIEMPGMSGMDAASLMRTFDTETPIIFVTNLAQFAVNGYEVDALGFIVKPVSYAAFSMRMAKALRVMRENRESSITVKTHGGMRVLGVEDITFIEVRGHELTYHLADGDGIRTRHHRRGGGAPRGCALRPHLQELPREHAPHQGVHQAGGRALRWHAAAHRPHHARRGYREDRRLPRRDGIAMDGAPLFALIGPALMLVQITVPVFALAAKLPRRGLPRIVEGIVPIVLMLPVWLFLTSRWQYFAPTDVPGTLTTFFIILALLVAAVMLVPRASAWSALFCASAGYTIQNIASSTSTLNGNVADLIGMHEVYAEHILIYEQVVLVIVYALAFLLFVKRIWKTRLELVEDRHMVLAFVACLFAVIGFDVLIKGAVTEGVSLELGCGLRAVHIAFCIFLLYFDYRTLSRNRIEAEAAVNRHIIKERERQYEESRLTIDAVNRRMHDICHSVAETAVEMGATGDPRVDELISQVLDEVRHYDTVISTGDEPLDTVLTEKGLVCEREGMRLSPRRRRLRACASRACGEIRARGRDHRYGDRARTRRRRSRTVRHLPHDPQAR